MDTRMTQTETVQERPSIRPACDIYENQDELLLVVDLPGVPADAVSVDLDKDTLTIVGRRPQVLPEGTRLIAGQGFGWDFRRQFTVGSQIDQERIQADLKNGVLEVHLPRHERTKPRRIAIGG
jgi:HSP20 family molecular chaperone IbpA